MRRMSVRPRRTRLIYFAYGGDLDAAQIATRCEAPELIGRAVLPGHRLSFHGRSPVWDGGEATVVEDETAELHGVLYRISSSDFDRLDIWQGVRLDGTGRYFHFPVDVVDETGHTVDALIYKRAVLGEPAPPSDAFLAHIVGGARARGLPDAYVATLAALPSRPAAGPVPREDRTAAFLLSGMACAC